MCRLYVAHYLVVHKAYTRESYVMMPQIPPSPGPIICNWTTRPVTAQVRVLIIS
jgi:hypothetical protein